MRAVVLWTTVLLVFTFFQRDDALVRQFRRDKQFKEVYVGEPRNSHPLVLGTDKLVWVADDGEHGLEPWVSRGSGATTQLGGDINPGSLDSRIDNLYIALGVVWFGADNSVDGLEPYCWDGIPGNILKIQDLNPGEPGSQPADFIEYAGRVYFTARHVTTGQEVWSAICAANSALPLQDVCPGTCNSNATYLTTCGGRLYWSANNGVQGQELYSYDGVLVTQIDINPGGGSSNPHNFACLNNELFFNAFQPSVGSALFKATGITITMMIDTNVNLNRYGPENVGVNSAGTRLYFSCHIEQFGYELCRSDGTVATSIYVHDIDTGKRGSRPGDGPASWVDFDGGTTFPATDFENGIRQLWWTTGEPSTAPPPPELPVNGSNICELLTDANNSQPCPEPMPHPPCVLPLFNISRTQDVTITVVNSTVEFNETVNFPNGTESWQIINVTTSYNVTDSVTTTEFIELNTYPCFINQTLQGASAKDFQAPEGNSSTFLYCRVGNASAAPQDMHVIVGAPNDHLVFRARDTDEKYYLYVGKEGQGSGPPATGTSLTGNASRVGIGACERIVDTNGFVVQDIQRPVTLPSTGRTYFFGRATAGTSIEDVGLWSVDAQPTATPPAVTCTTPGYVPNGCGICAPPGDHRSCRGNTCSTNEVDTGCGYCRQFWQPEEKKCQCAFVPTATAANPGFGVFIFNDIDVAIANCQSKELRLQGDASTNTVQFIIPNGMKIMTDDQITQPIRKLCAYWSASNPLGQEGLEFENIILCEPGITCAAAGTNAIVAGNLLSGPFNMTNVFTIHGSCLRAVAMSVNGLAYMEGNTFITTGSPAAYHVDLTLTGCGVNIARRLNFTRNTGTNLYGGMLRSFGATTMWVYDNDCNDCGGVGPGVFQLRGCPTFNELWDEVGLNTVTTVTNAGAAATTYILDDMPLHNVHGNKGSGLTTCMSSTTWPLQPSRGPPPDDVPYQFVIGTTFEGSARHLAHQNHRCVGTGIDFYINSWACEALCGMDEVVNLGILTEHVDTIESSPILLNTSLITSTLHLENGYRFLLYESTFLDNLTQGTISFGLNGLTNLNNNASCRSETFSSQTRCIQEWQETIPIPPTSQEVVGDYTLFFNVDMNFEYRMTIETPCIPFEWYRDDAYRHRIYGANTTMYLDEQLTIPYQKGTILQEDQRVYLDVEINQIMPQLPGDFGTNFEMEIEEVIMCFPNSSYARNQDPDEFWSLSWPPGPVTQFHPGNPYGTGCRDRSHGPIGEYLIYKRNATINETQKFSYQAFNASVYRLPTKPIHNHHLAFDMQMARNTDVQGSITVIYNIIRKKFEVCRNEYEWEKTWQNISYINQIQFDRACPDAFYNYSDAQQSGFYVCALGPTPTPEFVPDPLRAVWTGLAFYIVAGIPVVLIFITVYMWCIKSRTDKYTKIPQNML